MGNDNSKRHGVPPSVRVIPREPLQEQIELPEVEPGYPQARPPTTSKKDIYHPEENRDIYLHSLKAPKEIEKSWDDLVHYLTAIYRTDMMKVRSIFSWLGVQAIENESFTFVSTPTDIDEITPRGYKRLIKDRKGSYASLFAVLCRKAGIPCAIINGISKANGYEVGVKEVSHFRDRWNAVYVSGWRLMHPLWAFKAIISYKNGKWLPPHARERLEDFKEKWYDCEEHDFNEYFFIVEPSELISVCLPDNPKWQLCTPLMTLDRWITMPHFMKRYYMEGFKIPSEFSSTLKANDTGVAAFVVKTPENKNVEYQLTYDLFFNLTYSKPEVEEPIFLNRYVLMSRDSKDGRWLFEVRLPVAGLYRLTLYGGPSTKTSLPWICDVAIECETPAKMIPYPATPSIGYGPVSMTQATGLLTPSHTRGQLFVKPRQPFYITFSLQQQVFAKARLVHLNKKDYDECVTVTANNQSKLHILVVTVNIPCEGEFSLLLSTRPRESKTAKLENVCNYYISTDPPRANGITVQHKAYKTAFEVNTRKNLEDVSKGNDLTLLQTAVDKFKEGGYHEVDGSLEKATAKLQYLALAKALKDAINRLNLEMLNKAIEDGENSPKATKLLNLLDQAREERDKLLSMNKFLHDVLEMKHATLTEMISYNKPIIVINDVLKATLHLIGERMNRLQTWEEIKIGMRKTGQEGVLRRIKAFDKSNVSAATLRRVKKIVSLYNEDTVRSASAGAATFFLWVNSVVESNESDV